MTHAHPHHRPPPPTERLVRLGLLVLVFHLANSVLQEQVFHLPGFKATILLGCLQATCIAALAYVDFSRQGLTRKAPLSVYVFLSIFSAASTILTNEASHRVNYPTQVVFKSSKLLFVMALRAVALKGKLKTSMGEIVSALSIVVGLIVFTWATSSAKKTAMTSIEDPSNFIIGVFAIIIAVVCDAMLYIGEEKFCFHQYNSSNSEVILYCNAFAAVYGFLTLAGSGQMGSSLEYAGTHPSMLGLVAAFSLCNLGGTTFLLQVVSEFGSSTAVVITSTRKLATVMCSYIIFPKPFTVPHFLGLSAVAFGIWLHDHARKKDHAAIKPKVDDPPPIIVAPADLAVDQSETPSRS